MADLRLLGLGKRFGEAVAVDDLSLEVEDGELMTLLGPSGSGKTTVLRMIAGYTAPSAGKVIVGSREVQDLPPEKRDIGMVFQSYALFPHRDVLQNVAFGLERRRIPKAERLRRVREALAMVRLEGMEGRYPSELSGGQQQRVALARALVIRPTLLLLDEPLSNLDAKLRGELRVEIRRIQREVRMTTVLVTHDQEEALTVSDRVAVLAKGRVQQVAVPDELYHRPVNRFVADFVGRMNLLPVTRGESGGRGKRVYRLANGRTLLGPEGPERGFLGVRPEVIRVGRPPTGVEVNALSGTLRHRAFLGELIELDIALWDETPVVVRGVGLGLRGRAPGDTIELWWPVAASSVFDEGNG